VYLAINRKWRQNGVSNSRVVASTFLLVVASLAICVTGCGRSERQGSGPVVVDVAVHDFGELDYEEYGASPEHVFRLKNVSQSPVQISAVSVSCDCVVAKGNTEDIKVAAGATVDLPVSVSLRQKAGRFSEDVILRFRDDDMEPMNLKLKGFVVHKPIPSANIVEFRALPNGIASRYFSVSYVRSSHAAAAELKSFQIEGDPSQIASFIVSEPSVSHGSRGSDMSVDSWSFPVSYHHSGSNNRVSAKLIVSWKHPTGITSIDLVGEVMPPIELLSKQIYVPRLSSGVLQLENVPIRVNDSSASREIVVESSVEWIAGKIVVDSQRLELEIQPKSAGRFSENIF
jgi:hypothetical protein